MHHTRCGGMPTTSYQNAQNSRQSCTSSCVPLIVSIPGAFAFRLCNLVDVYSSDVSRMKVDVRTHLVKVCCTKASARCVDALPSQARPLAKKEVDRDPLEIPPYFVTWEFRTLSLLSQGGGANSSIEIIVTLFNRLSCPNDGTEEEASCAICFFKHHETLEQLIRNLAKDHMLP